MAIKNPNPNIKDFEVNDNTTWSSAHIAAGLDAAGVNVGTDGSIEQKYAQVVYDATLEEASQNINIEGINARKVLVFIDVTFTDAGSVAFVLLSKTDKSPDTFVTTSAHSTRTVTANVENYVKLFADCSDGILNGYGLSGNVGSYVNLTSSLIQAYTDIIDSKVMKDIRIYCSVALPVGTKIKVYAI